MATSSSPRAIPSFVSASDGPRFAVVAVFAAFGLAFGGWAGTNGATIARLAIEPAAFGLALTAFTVIYLVAMSGAGALAARIGAKRALLLALLGVGPALALTTNAGSAGVFYAGLLVFGAFAGLLDATMNAEAARVERALMRPIFGNMHGVASASVAVGALLSGYFASGRAPWATGLVAEAGLLAAAVLAARALPSHSSETLRSSSADRPKVVSGGLIVLGLAIGVSISCETASLSWSALLLRKLAPDLAAFSGLGVAFFAGCQAALRFNADRVRRRVSDRALILASFAVAALGFLIVAANLDFAASVAGFAIIGFGTAAIVPCGFALATSRPGISSGLAISAVSFFGALPRTPAPFVTGLVAEAFSLSAAFAGLAGLLIVALLGVLIFIPATPRIHRAVTAIGEVSA